MIRLDDLRIEDYLFAPKDLSFEALSVREAFLVGPKNVAGVFTPSIVIHTNKTLGNLERSECASLQVYSPES